MRWGPRALRTAGFVGGVLGTAFAVALGFGLIVPALPTFARQLGAGYTLTSAVISTFAGVRLVASAPAGRLVDRWGARPNVTAGLLVVAVSSAVIPLAGSALQLLVLRGFGGLGSALFIVGIGQHVVRTIPKTERGRANGLLQGAFLLGGASGPAVGGLVIGAFGIRAPFFIYAGTLLLATATTLGYMADERVAGPHVDGSGGGGRAGGPVPEPPDDGERPPRAAPDVGRSAPARVRVRDVLRDRTLTAVLFTYLAVTFASQGLRFVAIPLFGDEVIAASGFEIGLALTLASVGQALLLLPASHTADHYGRLPPLRLGSALLAVALASFTLVGSVPAMLAASAAVGASYGIASTLPATIAGDLAPPGGEGTVMGVLNVARDLGSIVGPLAIGLLAEGGGFQLAFVVCAGLVSVAFAATLVMRETLQPAG